VAQKPKDRSHSAPQGAFGAPAKPAAPSASPPPISFPPATLRPPPGAEEVVLDDIEKNKQERASSSFPAPLGQSEEHDAWTLNRLSRQSTVPPVRHDDVDRLRKMSATDFDAVDGGGALDLVDRSRPSQQLDLVGEMEELYALDDLTGALRHAELILGRQPDHEQAQRCAANCRKRLIALYTSKLGAVDRIVTVALTESQLRWLGLDHRAGFLLSRIDGLLSVEELLDVCGMPRLEALKTLVDLLERGAIRLQKA
jgi:hypothetical protein